MRLINADALKEQVKSHVVSMSVCLSMDEHYGKVTMREDCLEDIINAPTIDAIPVEWMVSWINRHPNDLRCVWFASLEMEWRKEQGAHGT